MIHQYKTAGGVLVQYEDAILPYVDAVEPLIERLDTQRGALFASSFEFPGRLSGFFTKYKANGVSDVFFGGLLRAFFGL